MAANYDITFSAGSPSFTIYPLEANGPNNVSVPRQIAAITAGGAGSGVFELNGDMTYRFVATFTFTVANSSLTGSPPVGLNDGTYTVKAGGSTYSAGTNRTTIPVDEAVTSDAVPFGTIQYSIPASEEATSLLLPGRGFINYGEAHTNSFVHLLENFASTSQPDNPILGQHWFDTSTNIMKVFGGGSPAFVNTGLQNIVEDLTPQLGGTLDVNTFGIVGAPAANATSDGGNITLTGADGGTSGLNYGGAITLQGGMSNEVRPGGKINILAGPGDATYGFGYGGVIDIIGGEAPYAGGDVNVTGGLQLVAYSGSRGGDVKLTGGAGPGSSSRGGHVELRGATAAQHGGDIKLYGGASGGTREGGEIILTSGAGSTTGGGGPVTITSGAGGATSGIGGDVDITSGAGGGQADGGAINLSAGDAGSGSGYRDGGAITITAGSRNETDYGNGGNISLTGGAADYIFSNGGNVSLKGGDNPHQGSGAQAGHITIDGGDGYEGGSVDITGGEGTVANGNAGSVTLRGGEGGLSNSAGSANLFGAGGTLSATPGDVSLGGGAVSGAGPGPGGNTSIFSGNGNLTQSAGTLSITAGSVTAGAGTGAGGDVAITSGDGGLTSGDAGDITLTPGAAVSGEAGAIVIAQTTAPSVTTDKLYNVSGALTWNGIDLTVATHPDYDAQSGSDGGGSPDVFTTAFSFSTPAAGKVSLQVFVNGVKQKEASGGSPVDGSYSITAPTTVTFLAGSGVQPTDDVEFYGFG